MRQTYREQMESHPLRRQIIVTSVVNDLVNGAGMTFFPRLSEETNASAEELVRANFVAREILARVRSSMRSTGTTTASKRRCRPGCGWRCARSSSERRAG